MRLFSLFILLIILPFLAIAQIQDDFSDGDFTNNPTWSGTNTQFKINSSKKLQLNSSGADTSYLATGNTLLNNTEWRFYIKQSFNSSSNNHSRIYLVSDQANLKSTLNGYFIQFGSTQDDICLYRQDGNTTTKIISGTNGNTGNSVNEFTLKATRDANGNWELFSDANAGNNFLSEGTATDITYSTTSYFGFWCKYTTSNSTKFYFDDVYVGGIVVDTIKPILLRAQALDSIHLNLYFSEALNPTTVTDVNNYLIIAGLGHPNSANIDPNNSSIIQLVYNKFTENKSYDIQVSNVEDLAGNKVIGGSTAHFIWHIVRQYEVLINEVMADPAPTVGLPDAEYIELYNTFYHKSLKGWTLQVGNTIKTLPDSTIAGGGYIIIGHQKNEADLSPYGTFIGLSSFSLTNSGQQLILRNEKGNIIHQVTYSDSWYQDNNKKDGGWSLEQIDPENPCGCDNNWKAAVNNLGGTPGSINSVNAPNPDQTKPELSRVSVVDSMNIVLHFTEKMDSTGILDISNYSVDGFGKPVFAGNAFPEYTSVALRFAKAFQKQTLYDLSIQGGLKDCVGNTSFSTNARFGMPEKPKANDIFINEILFDPQSPGVDYIEVKNRTDKVFDLRDLRLANWDEETQSFENVKQLSNESYLIYGYQYIVFSTNSSIIKKQYLVKQPNDLVEIPSMISMPNSEGNVLLISSSFELIDRLDYDKEMHFALLQNTKGISLERVNPDEATNNRNNWHSSATSSDSYSQSADFAGTPTSINSQFSNGSEFSGEIWVRNNQDIFSPDNDGLDDMLFIDYKFMDPGFTANIRVYDRSGKLIRNLVDNELLATNGSFSWDGLDNDNQKANIGIYVVYVEVFNLKGDVQHYKLKVVLAGRL